jgi:hypothetical protein
VACGKDVKEDGRSFLEDITQYSPVDTEIAQKLSDMFAAKPT